MINILTYGMLRETERHQYQLLLGNFNKAYQRLRRLDEADNGKIVSITGHIRWFKVLGDFYYITQANTILDECSKTEDSLHQFMKQLVRGHQCHTIELNSFPNFPERLKEKRFTDEYENYSDLEKMGKKMHDLLNDGLKKLLS